MDLCDNSNDGRPCSDPETDEPCTQCQEAMAEAQADAFAAYRVASPAERDPEGYARDMRDAGRAHLLPIDKRCS